MSVPLKFGEDGDDQPASASGQIDRFQLLDELQKALEAVQVECDSVKAAAPKAAREAAQHDRSQAEPAAPRQSIPAAAAPMGDLHAPAWLRKAPPSAPAPAMPVAPTFLRAPQLPVRDRRIDPSPSEGERGRLQRRQVEDQAQLESIFRRLTQRPPATAEEVEDVPAPPRRWFAWTINLGLAGLVGGGIAFCVVQFLDTGSPVPGGQQVASSLRALVGGNGSDVAPGKKSPRLIMSALSGAANRPVALGVNVEGAPSGASIVVRGMPSGSRVTAGTPAGEGAWRVPIRDLVHAAVMPPVDFVGTMNLSVDLRQSDGSVADSDVQQLKWTAGGPDTVAPKAVKTTAIGPAANPFPPPAPPEPQTVGSAPAMRDQARVEPQVQQAPAQPDPAAAGSRQLDRDEVANLIRRGQLALQNGDISAARLLLRRAAEANDVQAELALAATYDPSVLKEIGALGAKADVTQARLWYQRAAESGSEEATQRLRQLAQR